MVNSSRRPPRTRSGVKPQFLLRIKHRVGGRIEPVSRTGKHVDLCSRGISSLYLLGCGINSQDLPAGVTENHNGLLRPPNAALNRFVGAIRTGRASYEPVGENWKTRIRCVG